MSPLRLAFMGSPDLGVPCIEALHAAEDLDLRLVVTLGERRRGRRGRPEPTPVGRAARDLGLPCRSWEKGQAVAVRDALRAENLDLIVVIAFARILSPATLAIPRLGCLNLHASLLPWGRGASPIQAAIREGLETSGWSAMIMNEGLDTGPVLARQELSLEPRWTAGDLYAALKGRAPDFLLWVLRNWRDGELLPREQSEAGVTLTRRIPREAGALDWNQDATFLDRLIRSLSPAPGVWCRRDGERLGIAEARPLPGSPRARPGEVLGVGSELLVACARGALGIAKLKPEGKRAMNAADYLNGRPLAPGALLEQG